jgi:hypothetical protein
MHCPKHNPEKGDLCSNCNPSASNQPRKKVLIYELWVFRGALNGLKK